MPPKRRRKFHGLYYHSSPPKVFSMNSNSNSSKTSGRDEVKEAFVVKPSNIRIWIHDKDVGKLTRVLWAGQGNRLRQETSTHPRVKKFLETVPYVLNVIKEVHQAVVDNNLDLLISKTNPPVPPSLITTKDANGLTVMHKAAGLAHTRIVEHLLKVWPGGATDIDATGKTPLHWAASAKNNTRCYNLLAQAGADEETLDYRMKIASQYKSKPHDVDRSLLTVVPEAPRVPHESHPDWSALVDEVGNLTESQTDLSGNNENNDLEGNHITGNGMNLLTSRSKANTIDDTSEPDEIHDDQNNLTLEEQAVKAAIEDEQAFEKEQNAKDAQRNDSDDFVSDLNANTETTPPSTAGMDSTEAFPEEETIEDHFASDQSIQQKIDDEKLDDGTVDVKGENDEDATGDQDDVIFQSPPEPESVNPILEDDRKEEALNSKNVEVSIVLEEETIDRKETNENGAEAKEESEREQNELEGQGDNNEVQHIQYASTPMMLLAVPGDDSSDDGQTDVTEAEDSDTSQADGDLIMDTNPMGQDGNGKKDNDAGNLSNEVKVPDGKPSDEGNCDTQGDKDTIQENGKANDIEPIGSAESRAESGRKTDEAAPERSKSPEKATRIATPTVKTPNREAPEGATQTKNPDDSDNDDADTHAQETITSNGNIDENHNSIKQNGPRSMTPSSPALEYEGVVQGEADDNQVQSQSGGYFVNEVNHVQTIIDSGDMEQLATLVLNGEGRKLMGATSQQPEIQAFLDNVPSYMNKIRRVHQAARNGNIRDLQAALDRRKFAIAKDEISPDGATALHVATVFGHAGILRYLGGRFPETTSAVDDNGRTALHYAATINDNGHFYNLLINLGSNPKSADKLGNSAEYYRDNRDESMQVLSYRDLLQVFGANENMEDEMLADQVPDDLHSARRPVDDADILSTLERCFRILHEPNRQSDPLGSGTPSSASSLRLTVTTYLARFLKRSVFDKIKHRQTRLDHNLFDVIWPAMKKSSKERRIDEDLNAGVVAPDFDVYVVFQEFLVPLMKDMHCINQSQEFKPHPSMFYFPVVEGRIDDNLKVNMDDSKKFVTDGHVECSRNLDDYELPLNLNIGQIEQAERLVLEKILNADFAKAIGEDDLGTYYTMNEVLESPSEIRTVLATSNLLIPLLDSSDPIQEPESLAINGQYWPYGRGVYVSHSGDLAAWINVQEHLRIIVSTPSDAPADIGYTYSKLGRTMLFLEGRLHFRESYLLGYLSSRPSYLGTGLKLSFNLELPNLIKELENLRHLCTVRGLNMIPNVKDGAVRVVNMQSLGLTEWRLFQDYCTAVTNILQLERDMSLTNSKQIAAMLVKIFRRKKNSLVES